MFSYRGKDVPSSGRGKSVQLSHTHTTPQPLMSLNTHRRTQVNHPTTHTATTMDTQHTSTLNHPPDPHTRMLSKQYFKIIQAIHHKHIADTAISTQTFPPGMMRQVHKLSAFIKPSTPTEHTRSQIQANTINWMHTNMIILQQHYQSTIHTLTNTTHSPLALQIAIGWARKRYGHRLRQETIHSLQHTFNTQHTSSQPPPKSTLRSDSSLSPIPELSDEVDFPPLPAPHRPPLSLGSQHITRHHQQANREPLLPTPPPTRGPIPAPNQPPPDPPPDPPQAPRPQKQLTISFTKRTPPSSAPAPSLPRTPQQVPGPVETSSPLPQRTKRIPNQTTQEISPIYPANHKAPSLDTITSPTIHSKHNLAVITIDTISPLPLTPTGGAGDRTGLVGRRAPIEQLQEATPMMTGTPKANTATLKALSEPSTQHSFGVAPLALASLEATATSELESITLDPTYNPSFDPDISYSPGPCIPTCHNTRPDDWTITTQATYLVLGDGRISRFPSHSKTDLQLDSYPSANFRKFYQLFRRTAPNHNTSFVILAVGLNDRIQDPKVAVKQLQIMMKTATSTFPRADVYVPLINFSPNLSPKHKSTLTHINKVISTLQHIPAIPPQDFITESDNRTWTPTTAKFILRQLRQYFLI